MDLIEPKNSIWTFFTPPPYFSIEEVVQLPKPTELLMQLWEEKRYQAINVYKQQNDIENTELVAWYLWCCSKILEDAKNPKKPSPEPLV